LKEKILHITSVHKHDDIRIFHKECCSLSKEFDVTILNPEFNGFINGVKFEAINLPKNRFLRIVFGWIFCLKKTLFTDYKIIHFHDPELLLCVLFWKVRGYKTIYDIHEDIEEQIYQKEYIPQKIRKLISVLVYQFEKIISSIVSHNIVVTDFLQKKFSNSSIVYNYPLSKDKPLTCVRKNQMCYIGNLDKSRGIELMSRLAFDMETPIVIAGNASKDALEIINNNQYLDYRGFLGQHDIAEIMSNSKIGLILHDQGGNHKYGFPTKLFEYMQHSLPVIVSDNYYPRKIVDQSKCGYVVNIDSYKEIIQSVKSLYFNKELHSDLSSCAFIASKKYSWEVEGKKLINLYEELLLN